MTLAFNRTDLAREVTRLLDNLHVMNIEHDGTHKDVIGKLDITAALTAACHDAPASNSDNIGSFPCAFRVFGWYRADFYESGEDPHAYLEVVHQGGELFSLNNVEIS